MRQVPKSIRYVACPHCNEWYGLEELFELLTNKGHYTYDDITCGCGITISLTVFADRTVEAKFEWKEFKPNAESSCCDKQ